MDLMPFVYKAGCECLNESDDCGFENCLIKDSSYLESDCDEQVRILQTFHWSVVYGSNLVFHFPLCLQLLITMAFSQPVKLFSMKLQCAESSESPRSVCVYLLRVFVGNPFHAVFLRLVWFCSQLKLQRVWRSSSIFLVRWVLMTQREVKQRRPWICLRKTTKKMDWFRSDTSSFRTSTAPLWVTLHAYTLDCMVLMSGVQNV